MSAPQWGVSVISRGGVVNPPVLPWQRGRSGVLWRGVLKYFGLRNRSYPLIVSAKSLQTQWIRSFLQKIFLGIFFPVKNVNDFYWNKKNNRRDLINFLRTSTFNIHAENWWPSFEIKSKKKKKEHARIDVFSRTIFPGNKRQTDLKQKEGNQWKSQQKEAMQDTRESWKNTVNLFEIRFAFFFSSPEKNKRPAIFKPWSSKKEPQLITFLQNNFSIYLVQKELQKKHHYIQRKRNKKLNKEIKLQNESKIERKTSRKKQNKRQRTSFGCRENVRNYTTCSSQYK